MLWLAENDEMSLEFMYGAIDKDKKDGVSFKLINGYFSCVQTIACSAVSAFYSPW